MKTAVIYARYSSERQTEQSIEGQLRVCNEYATRNEIVILNTYIDRAMTGTNDNRTAFQQMLKDSSKKAWDYVLVYKIDRFSRNKYETAMHKRTLRDNGVKLLSAMENIPDTPEGIILESLLEGMAEYYSAELSQKVRRGMNESRQKGQFTGGYLLFGYRVENKKIVVCEDEANIVREIYSKFAGGMLVTEIIAELRERGVLYRGNPLARNTVYHILQNEKYAGIFRHGEEVFLNMYPRIVPDDIYQIVTTKLNNNKYGKHKPDIVYLLKNKVVCGLCGKRVNSDAGTSKTGVVMRYYKCTGRRTKIKCSLLPIRKELFEQLIIDVTLEVMKRPGFIEELSKRIIDIHKKRVEDQSLVNVLKREYDDVQTAINNILKAIEQGIVTSSTKDRLQELEEKKMLLDSQLSIEQSKVKMTLTPSDVSRYLKTALSKSAQLMIRTLVKEIVLYNDRVEITYNYTNRKGPDDNHQGFSFYRCSPSFEIDTKKIGKPPITMMLDVELYI